MIVVIIHYRGNRDYKEIILLPFLLLLVDCCAKNGVSQKCKGEATPVQALATFIMSSTCRAFFKSPCKRLLKPELLLLQRSLHVGHVFLPQAPTILDLTLQRHDFLFCMPSSIQTYLQLLCKAGISGCTFRCKRPGRAASGRRPEMPRSKVSLLERRRICWICCPTCCVPIFPGEVQRRQSDAASAIACPAYEEADRTAQPT